MKRKAVIIISAVFIFHTNWLFSCDKKSSDSSANKARSR